MHIPLPLSFPLVISSSQWSPVSSQGPETWPVRVENARATQVQSTTLKYNMYIYILYICMFNPHHSDQEPTPFFWMLPFFKLVTTPGSKRREKKNIENRPRHLAYAFMRWVLLKSVALHKANSDGSTSRRGKDTAAHPWDWTWWKSSRKYVDDVNYIDITVYNCNVNCI